MKRRIRPQARIAGPMSVQPKSTTRSKFSDIPRARHPHQGIHLISSRQQDEPIPLPANNQETELEAQKRVALMTHPLWISCLKAWWDVMDPHGEEEEDEAEEGAKGYITMEQYLDLNVRLQKSVVRDFDYDQACQAAKSDWDIDSIDCKKLENHQNQSSSILEQGSNTAKVSKFGFYHFAEYLFDLAQEFYPYVSPAIYLFIISAGSFLRSSLFKDVRDVSRLSESFFSTLLRQEESPLDTDFKSWHRACFADSKKLAASVTSQLIVLFPSDVRVRDIWVEMPESSYNRVVLDAIKRLDYRLGKVEAVNPAVIESVFERTSLLFAQTVPSPDESKLKSPRKPHVPVQPIHPLLPTDIQLEETPMSDPRIFSNRIEFRRVVKLPLLGKSFNKKPVRESDMQGSESHADTTVSGVLDPAQTSVRPNTRESNSQTHGIDVPQVQYRLSSELGNKTPRKRSSTHEKRILLQKSPHLPVSPGKDSSSPRLRSADETSHRAGSSSTQSQGKYRRADIKFAGLPKDLKRGRFIKEPLAGPLEMRGRINRKSQREIRMEKKTQANLTIRDTLESAEKEKSFRHRSLPIYSQRSVQVSPSLIERLPPEDLRSPASQPGLLGSERHSNANSIVEKESVNVPDLEDEAIKVAGRSFTRSKGANPRIENASPSIDSPFPSRMSAASSPSAVSPGVSRKKVAEPELVQKTATVYDFKDYAHLLQPNILPEQMEYDDPMEFLYALNVLKYQYNLAHQSEFLKAISDKNVYESRRDELGGAISNEEWKSFISRIEKMVKIRIRRRRLRRIRRRRLGIPIIKRKPEFGELTRPNLKKNRLWRSVFLPKKSEGKTKSEQSELIPTPPTEPSSEHRPQRLRRIDMPIRRNA